MKTAILIAFITLACIKIQAQSFARYFWSGALTSESIKVNAKFSAVASQVRLAVDTDSSFTNALYSNSFSVEDSNSLIVSATISNLQQNTQYYFAFEINWILDLTPGRIGSFKTAPAGPSNFDFAFNSCIGNAYHTFTQRVKNHNPLFFISSGDLHYGNPNSTDVGIHRQKYEGSILSREPTSSFFRNTPIAYTWDDHDFCGNASDSNSIGKDNARQAYLEYVPYYSLPDPNGAIFQSFTIGRLHFIMTDNRSTKTQNSMWLKSQHNWFRQEMLYARDNKLMAVWINSLPWNGATHHENWAAYQAERTGIGNFLRDSNIVNMMILCGDAHMLAIDDGKNADFSTGQNSPFRYPIFHAGGVARGGSVKGGQFNAGGPFRNTNLEQGHYGIVRVFDNGGDTICLSLEGYRTDNDGLYDSLLVNYTFCRNLVNPSLLSVNEVFVSPNPSFGTLNFIFNDSKKDVEIEVTNLEGKRVFKSKLQGVPNQKVFSISLPPHLKGIYIASIMADKETANRKIVIK
ncbi:MAG: alkaline phosphatase D family protein [Bacteroidia bacterium]|nr:alkaline phosphatase D family protein [Bacteroidia bacterium]